jgi:hypothetical protein
MLLIPPPTVRGIKTTFAVFSTTSRIISLLSVRLKRHLLQKVSSLRIFLISI